MVAMNSLAPPPQRNPIDNRPVVNWTRHGNYCSPDVEALQQARLAAGRHWREVEARLGKPVRWLDHFEHFRRDISEPDLVALANELGVELRRV